MFPTRINFPKEGSVGNNAVMHFSALWFFLPALRPFLKEMPKNNLSVFFIIFPLNLIHD